MRQKGSWPLAFVHALVTLAVANVIIHGPSSIPFLIAAVVLLTAVVLFAVIFGTVRIERNTERINDAIKNHDR